MRHPNKIQLFTFESSPFYFSCRVSPRPKASREKQTGSRAPQNRLVNSHIRGRLFLDLIKLTRQHIEYSENEYYSQLRELTYSQALISFEYSENEYYSRALNCSSLNSRASTTKIHAIHGRLIVVPRFKS